MKFVESESVNLELKRDLPSNDQVVKTIIGFCNQYGGKLVIGVDDTGEVVGLQEKEIEWALENLDRAIYQAAEPSIITQVYLQRFEGKGVIVVEVGRGIARPYFRKSEGIERGTYIRLGRNTLRATREMVREMQWMSRGIHFEEMAVYEASIEELNLEKFHQFLTNRPNRGQRGPTEEMLNAYHLQVREGGRFHPTVAGLLFFGHRPQHFFPEAMVLCSHFHGNRGREVIATVDCTGSLTEQYHQALEFIVSRLNTSYQWEGSVRKDLLEIPLVAIREALLNGLAHRNYHIQAPMKVAIYQDRVEIFSPGNFPGLFSHLRSGVSCLRNTYLCRLLREEGYIEKLGSGLIAILDSYEQAHLQAPQWVEGDTFVKCILPRLPELGKPSNDREKILNWIDDCEVSLKEVQRHFGMSRSRASRTIAALIQEGRLERTGQTRAVRYRLKKAAG